MSDNHNVLAHIPLFSELSEDARARVGQRCRWPRYERNQQIIDRDSDSHDVFVVIDGRVRVVNYSLSGREVSFEDIEPGGYFGELAAIDDGPRSAFVVALTRTEVLAMPPKLFRDLLTEYPGMARQVMVRLTEIVRQSTGRIFDLSVLGAHNRVQAELLRLARSDIRDDDTAVISPVPIQSDIASRVSTTRETVARVLGELTRAGIVRRERHALIIADFERLEMLVEEFGDA